MNMRPLLCALALSMIAATSARADPPVGATAEQLITDAGADGVFEPVADAQRVSVRHPRSGLICRLDPTHANRLVIFPQAARGEDVACESRQGGETIKLIATRYSVEARLDVQIRLTEDLIRRQFPDARELPPVGPPAAGAMNRTVAFMVTRDGVATYTRASIAVIGQWSDSLRYSAPAADAAAAARAEQTSSALWAQTLGELTTTHS
jgi:hypothetical protein